MCIRDRAPDLGALRRRGFCAPALLATSYTRAFGGSGLCACVHRAPLGTSTRSPSSERLQAVVSGA
eukprot:6305550-Alexandrium_andersonii.AAC.1